MTPANPKVPFEGNPYIPSPIVDGFAYSLTRVRNPMSYYWNCLAGMEALRRANGYVFRMHVVPSGTNVSSVSGVAGLVAATQAQGIVQDVMMAPGSYIWGMSLAASLAGVVSGLDGTNIGVRLWDTCTEMSLSSDQIQGFCYAEGNATAAANATTYPFLGPVSGVPAGSSTARVGDLRGQVLLPNLFLVGPTGHVRVEISFPVNYQASQINVQLVLMCAEPQYSQSVDDAVREMEYQMGALH